MRKIILALSVVLCIVMASLLHADYKKYSPDIAPDISGVIRGSTFGVIASYYGNFGPFREETDSQREVNALARYSAAKIFAEAFEPVPEKAPDAARYRAVMEETRPLVTDETWEYLSRYTFYASE